MTLLELQRAKSFLLQYLFSLELEDYERYEKKYIRKGTPIPEALESIGQELNGTINTLNHCMLKESTQIEALIEHLSNLGALKNLWLQETSATKETHCTLYKKLEYLELIELEFFNYVASVWAKIDFKSPLYTN